MTPLEFALITFVAAVAAGVLGSLLGLGGGIIVVPVLTLLLGVHIRYAIGASIVAVIATSSAAGAAYVKEHISNMRLGMVLEVATTSGALTGAFLAGVLAPRWLYVIFAVMMVYAALAMLRHQENGRHAAPKPDRLADALQLHGGYYDQALNQQVQYRVSRSPLGLGLSYLAGLISGLLGIGGGVVKVPVMSLAMGLPMKAASATSNFMIGVTAAASAGVYFARGDVNPFVAGPVAAGVLIGALTGSLLLSRIRSQWLRGAFVLVLLAVAVEMFIKGMHT